jgi:hypothetical protein
VICFADTDIVLKLAACDLLPETLDVLSVKRDEVYVFREEAYRVYRHDSDVGAQYAPDALKRALKFINKVHGVFVEIDREEQLYMTAENIDSGEQVIFSATRKYTDFQVITADRNALRNLAVANGCGAICTRMSGRVLCLEQILLLLVPHVGFDNLVKRVSPCLAHDEAFRLPFQPGTTQAEAEALLRQRIDLLRAQTRSLLASA